jgi:formate dehydrogenase maturation protein FdhE
MAAWERRLERAEALARQFPFSAELMYFYRDIVRFQRSMRPQDLEAFPHDGPLGAFYTRVVSGYPDAPHICPATFSHSDPEFPHIRVEVCEPCRIYWKAYDFALDPYTLPEVDDLASVPLDLWATAQGYSKPAPNLFGF